MFSQMMDGRDEKQRDELLDELDPRDPAAAVAELKRAQAQAAG